MESLERKTDGIVLDYKEAVQAMLQSGRSVPPPPSDFLCMNSNQGSSILLDNVQVSRKVHIKI